MTFSALPGNIVRTDFNGSSSQIYNSASQPIIASALVFELDAEYAKQLTWIAYSIARSPFVAAGGINSILAADGSLNNEVFGRLTVFRNFSQNPLNLFEPFYDAAYTNVLANPNASDYYGARIDYAREDKIFDVIISKIGNPQIFDLQCQKGRMEEKLTIALSPFYDGLQTAGTPKVFGDYEGEGLVRTLSIGGCYGY